MLLSQASTLVAVFIKYLRYWIVEMMFFFWAHRHETWGLQCSNVAIVSWSYRFKMKWSHDWLWIVSQRSLSCNFQEDGETMKTQFCTKCSLEQDQVCLCFFWAQFGELPVQSDVSAVYFLSQSTNFRGDIISNWQKILKFSVYGKFESKIKAIFRLGIPKNPYKQSLSCKLGWAEDFLWSQIGVTIPWTW